MAGVVVLFCGGCMVAGFLSEKVSAQVHVLAAAVLFLAGFQITAGMHSLAMLYIGFGIISGFAADWCTMRCLEPFPNGSRISRA